MSEDDDDVDRELRECQKLMNEHYSRLPPFDPWSVDELRHATSIVRAPWTEGGPLMNRIEERFLGDDSVRVRFYYPKDEKTILPGLIYLHGGGWTIFSIDTHDRLMREYAWRANIVVIGIDYSLSPEVKYPRAIHEIVSIVQWIRKENSSDLLIDINRIMIGGDSAGANLSVATNLNLRHLNQSVLSGQLLNYGVYDRPNRQSNSYQQYDGPNYRLTSDEIEFFQKNYIRNEKDLFDPSVVPLHADLYGLPPSLLIIAQCDILADENRLMCQSLRQANVQVEERVYSGATHSFLEAMKMSSISNQALDDSANWIKQLFEKRIN